MGHSYVDYRKGSHLMHDAEIAVIVYVMMDMARRVDRDVELTPNVHALLNSWQRLVEDSAPGCIDLDLDRFLRGARDRDSLRRLARQARAYVQEFGSALPADYLNRLVNAPQFMEFNDQPTTKILAAYDAFIALLDDN